MGDKRLSNTKEKKASFLCLCVGFALTENLGEILGYKMT